MKYRVLGKTGYKVSEISIGTWQLGGKWGEPFDKTIAQNTLSTAVSNGINLLNYEQCRYLQLYLDHRV